MSSVTSAGAPAVSVVLVTRDGLGPLQRTLASLRAQTVAESVEPVVVAIDGPPVDPAAAEFRGLATPRCVRSADDGLGPALAAGVAAARAEIVALGEDHAFPSPTWAERTVAAHEGGATAVGPALENANPSSVASWTNFLLAYGSWARPVTGGAADELPAHNSSYRRDALLALGERLGAALAREGALYPALRASGGPLRLEPSVVVAHENPSRLASTAVLRFNAGRLYAARRAVRERWNRPRRLLYVAGAPLIPPLRLARFLRDLRCRGLDMRPRVVAGLVLGTALDGAGQLVGFAAGSGNALGRLEAFELGRVRHLRRGDRPRSVHPDDSSRRGERL